MTGFGRRTWIRFTLGLLALFLAIQVVPYGRDHTNPAVISEPPWDSPGTRALAKQACFDCHSNETVWPGYAHVAPASWLVQRDVEKGRSVLNLSEWHRPQEDAKEAAKQVSEGEMPTRMYLLLHADARLNDADRVLLVRGLSKTLGTSREEDEDGSR